MEDKTFLVDAVAQYVQSETWQQAITEFLEANYLWFPPETEEKAQETKKGVGYTMEQYGVFQQFKEIVERLLEGVVSDLGCSGEDLVAVLEESARQGPSGERRFFIKTLLSFEEYEEFHTRISQYAAGQQVNASANLAAGELAEWYLQLAVAQSLLDAHAQGLLDEAEQSFLPWAEALVAMSQGPPVDSTPTEGQDVQEEISPVESEAKETYDEPDSRLKELERTLIRERLKVDLLVAQRIADANLLLKEQMLHLSSSGVDTNDENELKSAEEDLDALFVQVDTVRDRLKEVKSKCFEFKSVTQDAMDRMYLFLKEKIHYRQDLVSQEGEISEFIFGILQQDDAALIPLLLEWILLEAEGIRVQNQIQEQLGQGSSTANPSDEGYWTQAWDESAQGFYYFHSVTGESVWEPPAGGFYDANQEYPFPNEVTNEAVLEETAEAKDVAATISNGPSMDAMAVDLSASLSNVDQLLEMEQVLEKISREHDEERKRLELVFEVEKARQKEELRKRKEKRRRERLVKKKKNERMGTETKDEPSDETQVTPLPSPVSSLPPTTQRPNGFSMLADSKATESEGLSLPLPGHRRLDLAHLLSENHAKRHLENCGITLSPQSLNPQALLNPTSLKYLTETLLKKHESAEEKPTPNPKSARRVEELVLEETEDEK
ncbi:hypothetical protein Poli38472_005223 [Pythium oligandrum]|uniref:Cilia- and flagella-associated protein 36 n=1 Tax=Pythium oligandrum TaxID=41045 RepID=A0A8K1CG63_PYTOL|nr:hypothetical protein Poli38472_005223 [Pythium oligandrum]|eukprot:TMW62605.1 hypothetical protein Poli38472_005223 [Pythium oligandrum]